MGRFSVRGVIGRFSGWLRKVASGMTRHSRASETFCVVGSLNEVGRFPTFALAFKALFDAVWELMTPGTSWEDLESTCWIEVRNPEGKIVRGYDLHTAGEEARRLGLLTEGGGWRRGR